MTDRVSASQTIAAPADQIWSLVSDLPRMGEWSNENQGGRWLGDATGPAVGAQLRGSNRHGWHRWSTKATIVDCVPGERLRFEVDYLGLPISEWTYELSPTDDGCTVTESWVDRRHGWFKPLAQLATGVGDRTEFTRAGIEHTLEQLAQACENTAG